MSKNENKNRGLYDYIEKYECDITYRARVFESHNSKDFKEMNKKFKSTVHVHWNDDRDLNYLCDIDKTTSREIYYNFEL